MFLLLYNLYTTKFNILKCAVSESFDNICSCELSTIIKKIEVHHGPKFPLPLYTIMPSILSLWTPLTCVLFLQIGFLECHIN